ncbi:MAG: hypothetical protein O7A09_01065 [Proteobacteria bacterium]|nr:hypothetical protein [Pseudomonadota bacterium]
MTRQHLALATIALLASAPAARADLSAWLAAVAAGTPAGYVNTGITAPVTDDIGVFSSAGGMTYEFIVNAVNYPAAAGGSSALMGARGTGVGDQAGFKFEQWFNSTSYGLTNFGVADFFLGANMENVDQHVVYVANTTAGLTELFIDGVSSGFAAYAPVLSGEVGLAQAWGPTVGTTDPLSGTIHGLAVYDAQLSLAEILEHRDAYFAGAVGVNYCGPAIPNSTGMPGVISADGSAAVAANNLSLVAAQMPMGKFGYFLVSRDQGLFNPPNSNGLICLGGSIGRYNQPANIIQGPMGSIPIDLTSIPVNPPTAVVPGDTWNFQCWFRDFGTNNFTDGLQVTFF